MSLPALESFDDTTPAQRRADALGLLAESALAASIAVLPVIAIRSSCM